VDSISSKRLELVSLAPAFVEALLEGRRGKAEAQGGLHLPDGWPDDHDRGFLALRLGEMREHPELQEWLVRALVLPQGERPMVGHAGFHGPPGKNAVKAAGAVEIGYTVFEPYRGRGFATEAVRALIDWAATERGIQHFVASIAPENTASLAIVRRTGFVQTGRHWDDVDGEELEFELKL
jgi:[ribosomal protein S5]-alanine N-acetyltransferase